jgi:hypothetical protein
MSSWNWSLHNVGWKETAGLTMGMVVLIEGRIFYSDLVRGIAVGIYLTLLWLMLAERRAFVALLCAGFAVSAFGMTPFHPPEWTGSSGYVIAHLTAAMFIVILAWGAWHRHRLARGGRQVPQG